VRELWPGSTPIRRRLLGGGLNANGYYTTTDGGVPPGMWLRRHGVDEAR
jgi:hypothetical protein